MVICLPASLLRRGKPTTSKHDGQIFVHNNVGQAQRNDNVQLWWTDLRSQHSVHSILKIRAYKGENLTDVGNININVNVDYGQKPSHC